MGELQVVGAEARRIQPLEFGVEIVEQFLKFRAAANLRKKTRNQEHSFQTAQFILVEIVENLLLCYQDGGVAMIHKMLHSIRMKLMKQRHHHRSVAQCAQKRSGPVGRIACAQRHLVAGFKAGRTENQVHLPNLGGQRAVGQCGSVEVRKRRAFPVFPYAFGYSRK